MRWMPSTGAERGRVLLLGVLLVATVAFVWSRRSGAPTPAPVGLQTGPSQSASNPQGGRSAAGAPSGGSQMPIPLNLVRVEQAASTPEMSRNPFRYGVPPAPPPSAMITKPVVVAPPPPEPVGPPRIPLRLTGLMADPYGRPRAYLKDPASGAVFEVIEGQIIDGRYRVVKIGLQSVVVAYLDGSGQRTIPLGG